MINSSTEQDLKKAVDGNLDAFVRLKRKSHHGILNSSKKLNDLILRKDAVNAVLNELQNGEIVPEIIQEWASFMQAGFIANTEPSGEAKDAENRAIQVIPIEYDPLYEDKIASVLARLDEIGDVIDGHITNDEIKLMLIELNRDS